MGLYWVDKIDGTDDYIAKDVNDLAHAIQDLESGKVDKADGKVLSSNDFTDEDKAKLDNIGGALYSKEEIDEKLNDKADSAVTLEGYGITDAYTKSEVNSKVSGVYRDCGNITPLKLNEIVNPSIGDVYNITENGNITTSPDLYINKEATIFYSMNQITIDFSSDEDPTRFVGWDLHSGVFEGTITKVERYNENTYIFTLASDINGLETGGKFTVTYLSCNLSFSVSAGDKVEFGEKGWSKFAATIDLGEYIKKTDYPTTAKAGVVKTGSTYGLSVSSSGTMAIRKATASEIDARKNNYSPIVPYNLAYAVESVTVKEAKEDETLPISSDAVKKALDAKQDNLTFDSTPTDNSENPVTSGGIKAALDECVKNGTLRVGTSAPASDGSTKAPFPGALYINTSNGDIYRCDEITNSMPPGTYFYSWSKLPVSIPYASEYNKGGMVTILKDKGLVVDGPGGDLSLAVAGSNTLGGIKVKHPSQSYLNIDEDGFLSVASENLVIDDITETSTTKALSANMGRHLLELINMKLDYGGKIGGATFDNKSNGYIYQIPSDGTYVVNLPPETSSGNRQSDTTIYVNTLFSVDFMVGAVVKLKVNSTETFCKITAAEIDNSGAVLTLNKSIAEGASIEILNFAKSYSLKAKDIVLCDRQEGLILLHRDYSTIISTLEQRIKALEQKEV